MELEVCDFCGYPFEEGDEVCCDGEFHYCSQDCAKEDNIDCDESVFCIPSMAAK
jgi:ribosomal protein L24E